jgi:hypothetical protein
MFDLPSPFEVLDPHAGIAALAVQHTAVRPLLLRRLENPVDGSSIIAGGAADEHGHSSRVVRGDLSGLQKKGTVLCETKLSAKTKGRGGGGRGGGLRGGGGGGGAGRGSGRAVSGVLPPAALPHHSKSPYQNQHQY